MKKYLTLFIVTMTMLTVLPIVVAEDGIRTLRGIKPLDSKSADPKVKTWQVDQAPIDRDFVHQPPLVPHTIQGYKVNLKFNKCLTCHSWANYKEAGATKISQTHFSDRDGNDLANISARRYFCTQCHVPQVEAKPLVENTFKPVRAIHGR